MTPERYLRINALADEALDLPEERRAAFLAIACGEDRELLHEVEQLLGAHSSENRLMEEPLLEQLAQDLSAAPSRADFAGKTFQHYQVLSRIGAGGVGEVWLAKDVRLGRQVAVKLLSPLSATDPAQIRRFEREARAASSLNHPNIVTIYEIGTAEGFDFIAEEFVEGQTLRQALAQGALPFTAVLEAGAQVSSALAVAHGAGIVHRDIKPENIMLRRDGLFKVLDFGLARFVEQLYSASSSNFSLTRTGFVMGTPKYMSPEQARGLSVDERSDIFSLGVVLYEIASGVPPFSGRTASDIVASILAQDPQPISRCLAEAPPQFEAILNRCLEKDPEKRYASARNLQVDLEQLLHTVRYSASRLAGGPVESALAPAAAKKRLRKFSPWVTAFLLSGLFALLGFWFYLQRWHATAPLFTSTVVTRLITHGKVEDAALSPDGKYVAYFLDDTGGQSLWIRLTSSVSDKRILSPEPGPHSGLAFSSKGDSLFWRRSTGNGGFALYRMSARGASPIRLRDNLNSAVAFSPDGAWYAYVQIDPLRRESALMLASADGAIDRPIIIRQRPRYFSRYGLAWSPDNRYIACFVGEASAYSTDAFHLVRIRVADAKETSLSQRHWLWGGTISWPISGTIFASATTELDDAYQIWAVSALDGRVTKVTNDFSNYSRVSASARDNTILALETQKSVDLWLAPNGSSEGAVQITSGVVRGFNSLAWTPDSRIVYSAISGDFRNVWMIDASGSNLKQLTSSPNHKQELAVTPDGKYILYHSAGAIWRMNVDGTHPLQLTHGANDVHPEPWRDSRSVLYASFLDWSPGLAGKPTLWGVPIQGGTPVSLSGIAASVPRLSPDGKLIACEYFPGVDPQLSAEEVAILPARGGEPLKIFNQLPSPRGFVSWAPDSRAIEFNKIGEKVDNIWRFPLSGGTAHPVTNFKVGSIAGYAWSRDGKTLAVARENVTRDIVLIKTSIN